MKYALASSALAAADEGARAHQRDAERKGTQQDEHPARRYPPDREQREDEQVEAGAAGTQPGVSLHVGPGDGEEAPAGEARQGRQRDERRAAEPGEKLGAADERDEHHRTEEEPARVPVVREVAASRGAPVDEEPDRREQRQRLRQTQPRARARRSSARRSCGHDDDYGIGRPRTVALARRWDLYRVAG